MSRFRFKPTLRQALTANAAAIANLAGGTLPADLQRTLDKAMPPAPVPRKKREVKDGVDIDKVHGEKRSAPKQLEAPVVQAIRALLSRHPRVLWVLRVNSGSASYEAKSGRWAPVKFHEWLRSPIPMRMPDFFGMLIDGRVLALEAKRPDWSKPTDQREREQAAFLQCIRDRGGVGAFVRNAQEAHAHIEGRE